jgi:hypothetical protein
MVYDTSENYNLGQLRAKLLARQEYSVNHHSLEKEKMVLILLRK